MRINRLISLLEDWSRWMKNDSHKLGYPDKVNYMSTGGYSANVFDDMCDKADNDNVQTLDAIIDSLPKDQKQAIYARFLKEKKPLYYEQKLNLAIDNLLTIADRRMY